MGIKRHKSEEIVTKLRQFEVLCGQGMPRVDVIRQMQISEQSFYCWRKQYRGMGSHHPDGTEANHALKFKLDHSSGADQLTFNGLLIVRARRKSGLTGRAVALS